MNEPQYTLHIMGRAIPHHFIGGAIKEGWQLGLPFTVSLIATQMICCSWTPGQAIEYTTAYQRWYKNQSCAGATSGVRR